MHSKICAKLFLLSGLTGVCYFFVRTTSKGISTSNIANEVNFSILDAREGGVLKGVEEILGRVMVPALKAQNQWGQLSGNGGSNEQQVRILKYSHVYDHLLLKKIRHFYCVYENCNQYTVTLGWRLHWINRKVRHNIVDGTCSHVRSVWTWWGRHRIQSGWAERSTRLSTSGLI